VPKIYLYKSKDSDSYDCVDGQQRIDSIIDFFDGKLAVNGKKFHELFEEERNTVLNYKFTMTIITEASDEELRLLFLRLQLGSPLNAGEKLHAMTGDMKEFVFDIGKNHPFFSRVDIPERRFAKETVFAQICINSFYRSLKGTFYAARFSDLKAFFEQYSNLKPYSEEVSRIKSNLDLMDKDFGDRIMILKTELRLFLGIFSLKIW